MTENPQSIGVDRAGESWFVVSYSRESGFDGQIEETIEKVRTEVKKSANRILIDIPIGLCDKDDDEKYYGCKDKNDEMYRECDSLARSVLGDRWPSVFTPPCRTAAEEAVAGESYSKVSTLNEDITGKG
jgi:predicted RNase H-like nuclease